MHDTDRNKVQSPVAARSTTTRETDSAPAIASPRLAAMAQFKQSVEESPRVQAQAAMSSTLKTAPLTPEVIEAKREETERRIVEAEKSSQDSSELTQALSSIQADLGLKEIEIVNPLTPQAGVRYQINPWFERKLGAGRNSYYKMTGQGDKPITKVEWESKSLKIGAAKNTEVGVAMEGTIAPDHEQGSESTVDQDQKEMMGQLLNSGNTGVSNTQKFIRGHLLNDNIGGPGLAFNLFPITADANAKHLAFVEKFIKSQLKGGYVAYYKVIVEHDDPKKGTYPTGEPYYTIDAAFNFTWSRLAVDGKPVGTEHIGKVTSKAGLSGDAPLNHVEEYKGWYDKVNRGKKTPEVIPDPRQWRDTRFTSEEKGRSGPTDFETDQKLTSLLARVGASSALPAAAGHSAPAAAAAGPSAPVATGTASPARVGGLSAPAAAGAHSAPAAAAAGPSASVATGTASPASVGGLSAPAAAGEPLNCLSSKVDKAGADGKSRCLKTRSSVAVKALKANHKILTKEGVGTVISTKPIADRGGWTLILFSLPAAGAHSAPAAAMAGPSAPVATGTASPARVGGLSTPAAAGARSVIAKAGHIISAPAAAGALSALGSPARARGSSAQVTVGAAVTGAGTGVHSAPAAAGLSVPVAGTASSTRVGGPSTPAAAGARSVIAKAGHIISAPAAAGALSALGPPARARGSSAQVTVGAAVTGAGIGANSAPAAAAAGPSAPVATGTASPASVGGLSAPAAAGEPLNCLSSKVDKAGADGKSRCLKTRSSVAVKALKANHKILTKEGVGTVISTKPIADRGGWTLILFSLD